MYVCLCLGITTEAVHDAVVNGASTSKQVGAACGAGTDCGRCRRTLRAIIASQTVNGDAYAAPAKQSLWTRVKHLGGHRELTHSGGADAG